MKGATGETSCAELPAFDPNAQGRLPLLLGTFIVSGVPEFPPSAPRSAAPQQPFPLFWRRMTLLSGQAEW